MTWKTDSTGVTPKASMTLLGTLVSACLGFQLALMSANANGPFQHRQESVQQQLALWSGELLPFDGQLSNYSQARNRVLFPAVLTGASLAYPTLSSSEWYLLLRILFGVAAQVGVFACLMAMLRDVRLAMLGVAAMSYCMMFTFSHPWEHAWDFADSLFPFVFVVLTIRSAWASPRNRALLLAVVLFATTNRESAAFAGLIWLCVHALSFRPLAVVKVEALYGAILIGASLGLATALRQWFAPGDQAVRQILDLHPLGFVSAQGTLLLEAIRTPSPGSWLAAYGAVLIPWCAWTWINRRRWAAVHLRLLLATVLVAGVSLLFGNINELRAFIPVFSLLVCVGVLVQAAPDTGESHGNIRTRAAPA